MASLLGINGPGKVPNQPGPTGYWAAVQKAIKSIFPRPGKAQSEKNAKPFQMPGPQAKVNRKYSPSE